MPNQNYGKYEVPDLQKKGVTLQDKLADEGMLEYGSLQGLYFTTGNDEIRYLNTPLDAIIFA